MHGDHESVGSVVLERLRTLLEGFDAVRHEHEAVVVIGAPVLQALDHRSLALLTKPTLAQHDLATLAAVQRGTRAAGALSPLDVAFTGGERSPLHRIHLAHHHADRVT